MADLCRMSEAQYRKAKKLIRGLCCNYDGGNCILLDDGEPYLGSPQSPGTLWGEEEQGSERSFRL